MSKKIFIACTAIMLSVVAFASVTPGGGKCDTTVCPGGSQKCCTDACNNTFYNAGCGC